jgi:two-component system, NarL family, invasion response regulator UvrY
MIRVLVADDHAIIRTGVRQLLADTTDVSVTGEAADGELALDLLRREPFDVIVLDLSMPGRGGMEALAQIHTQFPQVAILVLSMYQEELYAARAFRLGASGYVSKQSDPEELLRAIRRVAAGRKYVSEALAERLASELHEGSDTELHKGLSNRELQIMLFIARGMTVSEIAVSLSLSVKTVSTYRERVLGKMNMHSNAELMRYVIANRLDDQS